MGPIVLFDKSFLEGLAPDEAVWFDHFFLANVCPMFYVETQSDLAKEGSDRGTPDELVRKLANKFPDFSGSPNVHHTTMCTANLLGEEIPLRSQVILPRGCQATVSGHPMAMLPESPEAQAFLRWTQGKYQEEERRAAAEWRKGSVGHDTSEVLELFGKLKIDVSKPCTSMADVLALTDEVKARLKPEQQVYLAMQLLCVNPGYGVPILLRFKQSGEQPLSTFAPYVDYCLRVELFFHLAVSKSRMGAVQRTDLCYLFYLPFCQVFVSKDWVHKQVAPLFLRADQEFVSGEDFKAALKALNDQYLALPEPKRNKSIHLMAPRPPKDGDNLVTKLWDRHWPKWRNPKSVKAKAGDWRKITAMWKEKIKELQLIAKAGAGDDEHLPIDDLDVFIQERTARKRKGSWWLVPEALRGPESFEDDQVFEYRNGATPENVMDQDVSVYIRRDAPDLSYMPKCRTFMQDGKLHVDCAPPLKRRYTAPVPKGTMIAKSNSGDDLAVFVPPDSVLGGLIEKLWEKEKKRGYRGERRR